REPARLLRLRAAILANAGGRVDTAYTLLHRALRRADVQGQFSESILVRLMLSTLHISTGDFAQAETYLRKLLTFRDPVMPPSMEGATLLRLGTIAMLTDALEDARQLLTRADACFERASDRYGLANARIFKGRVELQDRKLRAAWDHLRTAQEDLLTIGN